MIEDVTPPLPGQALAAAFEFVQPPGGRGRLAAHASPGRLRDSVAARLWRHGSRLSCRLSRTAGPAVVWRSSFWRSIPAPTQRARGNVHRTLSHGGGADRKAGARRHHSNLPHRLRFVVRLLLHHALCRRPDSRRHPSQRLASRDAKACETFSVNPGCWASLSRFAKRSAPHIGPMGIVHRDIKPANIMNSPDSAKCWCWIGAWRRKSLARLRRIGACGTRCRRRRENFRRAGGSARPRRSCSCGAASGRRASATSSRCRPRGRPGPPKKRRLPRGCQILGTPGYLSPEQAEGQAGCHAGKRRLFARCAALRAIAERRICRLKAQDASSEIFTKTALGEIVPIKQWPEGLSAAQCSLVRYCDSGRSRCDPEDPLSQRARNMAGRCRAVPSKGRSAWKPSRRGYI